MTDLEAVEDPRVTDDICGVTYIGGTGLTWICIKKPHQPVYASRRHGRNTPDAKLSENPSAFAHYMVNRWPHRTP